MLALSTALAAPPVGVGAWPEGFRAAFTEHQQSKGRSGAALEPVCEERLPGVQLCLTVTEGTTRRPVTLADMAAWEEQPAAAFARARQQIEATWPEAVAPQAIDGVAGEFYLRASGDGLDAAAALFPELLAERVGGDVVLAIPARGSVLFWRPGRPDLDAMVAVGVRRSSEAAAQPVSDRVFRWDGARWTVWGRAEAPPASTGP
jgi:hypothetical protein